MPIADERHMRVTTFGPAGEPASSTEWVVGLDDSRIGFWTPDSTEWTARLATSPVVTVQASGSTGTVKREQPLLEGRAELLADGPVFDEVKAAILAKYSVAAPAAGLLDSVRELGGTRTPEAAVVIDVVG